MFLETVSKTERFWKQRLTRKPKTALIKAQNGGHSKPAVLCRVFIALAIGYGCYCWVIRVAQKY